MKKLLYGFLISLFLIQNVYSAVPVTFTNGTTADATEVNQNFNYFENKFSTTSGHDHDGSDSKTLAVLGTITTGIWQATIIDEVYGGTGYGSYASGDLVYATADTGLAKRTIGSIGSLFIRNQFNAEPDWLAPGTSGTFLRSKGTGVNPAWENTTVSVALGSFTRDTTLASGTQAVTGVGFQPTVIIFFATQTSSRETSWGFDNDTTNLAIFDDGGVSAGTYNASSANSIYDNESSGVGYVGNINTLDSDGFTINWTKSGSPTGTLTVYYLAIR